MRTKELKLIKRKKYRTSNIVSYEMVAPKTVNEIASYLSQYVDGITPSIVKRLWASGKMASNSNRSNLLYADDYIESLMMVEDEKKKRIKELEKKHGRF